MGELTLQLFNLQAFGFSILFGYIVFHFSRLFNVPVYACLLAALFSACCMQYLAMKILTVHESFLLEKWRDYPLKKRQSIYYASVLYGLLVVSGMLFSILTVIAVNVFAAVPLWANIAMP